MDFQVPNGDGRERGILDMGVEGGKVEMPLKGAWGGKDGKKGRKNLLVPYAMGK